MAKYIIEALFSESATPSEVAHVAEWSPPEKIWLEVLSSEPGKERIVVSTDHVEAYYYLRGYLDAHPAIESYVESDGSCESGRATGERCEWKGSFLDLVTVEFMPEDLRTSHAAVGNRGKYPANGAVRIRCCPGCRATFGKMDPEFFVVES